MPVSYRVDHARGMIRTICTGPVRLPEVLEHFEILRKDPFRPREPDVLLSMVGLETPPLSPELYAVADDLGRGPPLQFRHCAIVADRDVVFGIARMFEAIAGKHFREVRVFRDGEAALAWLESSRPVS